MFRLKADLFVRYSTIGKTFWPKVLRQKFLFLTEITGDLTIEINKVYGFAKLAILIIMKIVTCLRRNILHVKDENKFVSEETMVTMTMIISLSLEDDLGSFVFAREVLLWSRG